MGPEILLVPQAHIRSIAAVWFNLGANNVSISDVLGLTTMVNTLMEYVILLRTESGDKFSPI